MKTKTTTTAKKSVKKSVTPVQVAPRTITKSQKTSEGDGKMKITYQIKADKNVNGQFKVLFRGHGGKHPTDWWILWKNRTKMLFTSVDEAKDYIDALEVKKAAPGREYEITTWEPKAKKAVEPKAKKTATKKVSAKKAVKKSVKMPKVDKVENADVLDKVEAALSEVEAEVKTA